MTTWKDQIVKEMEKNGETWNDRIDERVILECHTGRYPSFFDDDGGLNVNWYDIEFDDGLGIEEGVPFLLWTERFVYFPVCYDGAEWVGSVPRDPARFKFNLRHFGGG